MAAKTACPTEIATGDVLKERNGDHIYIVLRTGRSARWTHLIEIECGAKSAVLHKALPFKVKTDELLTRLSDVVEPALALEKLARLPGNVSLRRQAVHFGVSHRSVRYQEIAAEPTRSRGWGIISGLLTFDLPPGADGTPAEPSIFGDQFEALLHKETRRKRILQYCAASAVSEDTVYRVFRRFCQQGMTPAAAADDYDLSGGRGKSRIAEPAQGRPRRRPRPQGDDPRQDLQRLLALAADYYFAFEYARGKKAKKTLEQAIRWIKTKFLCDRSVLNGDGELIELKFDQRLVPTERKLQYYIYRNYSYEERRIHQIGLRQWLLHERPLVGRLRTSRGPGERYHIDATIVDIYLVGQILRTRVIGRPTLYLVVDDFTAMVVGFYLTFEAPSWDGAMLALANAVAPKVAFCQSLGIAIEEKDWPAHRLCEILFADQGEVSSVHKAHPVISHYRVEIQNETAYRPDLRAIMERRFRTLPAIWNGLVPGVVEKESFDRGVAHPALHAALQIHEMRRVICYAILSYNKRIVRGYPTPPEMVDAGLAPTPLNLWTYGTKVNGCGRQVDVEEFRAKTMPTATARIDGQGICHNGLHYACPTLSLVERQAMFRGQKLETEVLIGYDAADNSQIQLHGLVEPVSCSLSDHEIGELRGVTYLEQSMYTECDAANRKRSKGESEASHAMTDYNIAKIAKDAISKTSKALQDAGMTQPDVSDMEEARGNEQGAGSTVRAGAGSKKGGRSKGRSRTGRPFTTIFAKSEDATDFGTREPQQQYDGEGDACDDVAGHKDAIAADSGRMTSRQLREKRARQWLAEPNH
ncbi:integrase [bacterium M00.F.Ca.ET.228.01.1.1]|nr:integrase [bacterium M00.F.Ca.ET.228.01.1.1]TGR95543.1 integrase [bacterium M00.F.Ca.ET.191.01.1.1]TGT96532.1 integrase [bacterium M00.F.Ca.ET.155.01.1.1]